MDKSNLTKLKEAAAKFLAFGKEPAPVPEKFEGVKVKDGDTVVEYDPELTIGSPVMVSSGTGSVPAPDDTYTLENGVVIVVVGGLLESVTDDGKGDPDKAAEPEVMADAETVSKADYDALLARVEALENASKPSEDFSAIPTKAELIAFTAQMQNVGQVIELLSAIPMDTPAFVEPNAEADKEAGFKSAAALFAKQKVENV